MELLILFNAQWHGIRDVVLSEAKRQMATRGKVDARQLTAKLHEETAKWQRGVLARGVWFKAFMETKPEEAARFSIKTDTMSILEPIKNKKPSNGWVLFPFRGIGFFAWLCAAYRNGNECCRAGVLSCSVIRHHADAVCPCKKQAQGIF